MARTVWHILKVSPSKTLQIHAELMRHGFDVWTPFETRHQALTAADKRKRIRRKAFAHPIFGEYGFMFVKLTMAEQSLRLHTLIEAHRFIHGVVLSPAQPDIAPTWYEHPQSLMDGMVERHGRSYDPKRDARMNNTKLYGQKPIVIPEFKQHEIVRFISGPMQGIEFTVLATIGDKVEIEPVQSKWMAKVEADAYDLKKAS